MMPSSDKTAAEGPPGLDQPQEAKGPHPAADQDSAPGTQNEMPEGEPDTPADPSPSDPANLAPSPSTEEAGLRCGYFDVRLVSRLQDELLLGLARAAVKRVEGNPFKDCKDVVGSLQADLVAYLQKKCGAFAPPSHAPTGESHGRRESQESSGAPESEVLLVVRDWLAAFGSAKQNVFSKVTSVFTDVDPPKVNAVLHSLQLGPVWPTSQREALTRQLIKALDAPGLDHCLFHCESAEALTEHKAMCPVRPVTCPFPGCNDSFKASHFVFHDRACPYKAVPCHQGCGEAVPRKDMMAHCQGPCAHREMVCPFRTAGCAAQVLQGGFAEHLQSQAPRHLEQVYGVVCVHTGMIQQQGQLTAEALATATHKSKALHDAVEALRAETAAQVKALEKKVSSLQKDDNERKKEVHALKKTEGELKKEVADLRKENVALAKSCAQLSARAHGPP